MASWSGLSRSARPSPDGWWFDDEVGCVSPPSFLMCRLQLIHVFNPSLASVLGFDEGVSEFSFCMLSSLVGPVRLRGFRARPARVFWPSSSIARPVFYPSLPISRFELRHDGSFQTCVMFLPTRHTCFSDESSRRFSNRSPNFPLLDHAGLPFVPPTSIGIVRFPAVLTVNPPSHLFAYLAAKFAFQASRLVRWSGPCPN